MTPSVFTRRAAVVAVAVLALAGCSAATSAAPEATPSASASSTATASPSPSPSFSPPPIPTAPPVDEGDGGSVEFVHTELADLVLTGWGLVDRRSLGSSQQYAPGSIYFTGSAQGSDPAYSIVEPLPDGCTLPAMDRWQAKYPDRPLGDSTAAFEVASGPSTGVFMIAVFSPEVATDEGIRVGSTRAQMLAAYPNAGFAFSDAGRDRYMIPTSGYQSMNIDVGNGTIASMPADTVTSMGLINAGFGDPGSPIHILGC